MLSQIKTAVRSFKLRTHNILIKWF